jgi:hypothetical protein
MVWRFFRQRGVIPVVLIVAAFVYWKLHPRAPRVISVGYVADRNVELWNTLAQVKQPVAELHYGDRVEVMRVEGTSSQVRNAAGLTGWIMDSREIMDSELWAKSAELLSRARALPPQARGKTKTVSNVRIEPGRNGRRIFQFMRGTPVVVLERTVADAAQGAEENSQEEKGAAAEQKPKQEDWLLVLRADSVPSAAPAPDAPLQDSGKSINPASGGVVSAGPEPVQSDSAAAEASPAMPAGPVAGWVLARFIELDLPGPVRDYASSADLRVVAAFELNRVPDGSGGEAPQYLVAGTRGPEGQTCDFTMLRVYTWGAARKRYETAYVESDLCGRLPIRVLHGAKGPEFQFSETGNAAEQRTYVMQQTAVRRVKDAASPQSQLRSHSHN